MVAHNPGPDAGGTDKSCTFHRNQQQQGEGEASKAPLAPARPRDKGCRNYRRSLMPPSPGRGSASSPVGRRPAVQGHAVSAIRIFHVFIVEEVELRKVSFFPNF